MPTTSTILRRLASATVIVALAAEPAAARAGQQPEGPEAPAAVSVPGDGGDGALQQWTAQRRKLRIQLGVSAGFTGAFLLSGILPLAIPIRCPDDPEIDCEPYGRWIAAGVMFIGAVIAAIPTAVYGVRLRRHNERRPVARMHVAPTGLVLRF